MNTKDTLMLMAFTAMMTALFVISMLSFYEVLKID